LLKYTFSKFGIFNIMMDFALHQSSSGIHLNKSMPTFLRGINGDLKTLFLKEANGSVISVG